MDTTKQNIVIVGKGTVVDVSIYQSIVDNATVAGSLTDTDVPVKLPKIQIILATKSAEAELNGMASS